MRSKIIVIQGERGEGKTTFVKELAEELRKKNVVVGGILAEGFWKEGRRDSFQLLDLKSESVLPYCQRQKKIGWEKVAGFYVNPEGQEFGEHILKKENLDEVELLIVDELGPFELQGKGWSSAIHKLLTDFPIPMVWVVRNSLVEELIRYFQINNYCKYQIHNSHPNELATYVKKEILNS